MNRNVSWLATAQALITFNLSMSVVILILLLTGCSSVPHIVETMADNGCALKSYSEKGKVVKIECHANTDR